MAKSEKIYIDRDNLIQRQLTKAGAELSQADKDAITEAQIYIGGICWKASVSDAVTVDDGYVILQLGPEETLPDAGTYTAYITIFDADTTDGYAWGSFKVDIEEWPGCST